MDMKILHDSKCLILWEIWCYDILKSCRICSCHQPREGMDKKMEAVIGFGESGLGFRARKDGKWDHMVSTFPTNN